MPYPRQQPGRQFYRWYFYDPSQPLATQTKGVPVKLKSTSWFGGDIGSAVVKDMSGGGAGLLVPRKDKVPEKFWVGYDRETRVKAQVKYRQLVDDKLEFLGGSWVSAEPQLVLKLLRKLRRRAFVIKQQPVRLVQNTTA